MLAKIAEERAQPTLRVPVYALVSSLITLLQRFTALITYKQQINLMISPYSKNSTEKSATYDKCEKQDL